MKKTLTTIGLVTLVILVSGVASAMILTGLYEMAEFLVETGPAWEAAMLLIITGLMLAGLASCAGGGRARQIGLVLLAEGLLLLGAYVKVTVGGWGNGLALAGLFASYIAISVTWFNPAESDQTAQESTG